MEIKKVGGFSSFTIIILTVIMLATPIMVILTNINLKNSSPSEIVGIMIEGEPRLRKLIVQDKPVHNSESIKAWVKVATSHFFNYTSNNYKDVIREGRKYMTARFYNGFYMNHAIRINQNIKNGYYISSTVITNEPVLVAKAVRNGQDYYKYYLEGSTVYKAESRDAITDHKFIVTVKMENPEDNLRGLAIDELVIK